MPSSPILWGEAGTTVMVGAGYTPFPRFVLRLPVVAILLAATGCAPLPGSLARPTAHEVRLPVTRAEVRDEFTAALELRATGGAELVVRTKPSGSVRLNWRNDDVLEYDLKLSGCEGIHFTTARIVRLSPEGNSEVVATLFSDMLLTGPHVQMRGTGSLARGIRSRDLAEEIQDRPGSFLVRVSSQSDDSVVLEGILR